jgi:hypothetical protein
MTQQDTSSKYFDTETAAKFLGLSKKTLEKYRFRGCGPEYFQFGRRCLYTAETLAAWAESCRRTSTSVA